MPGCSSPHWQLTLSVVGVHIAVVFCRSRVPHRLLKMKIFIAVALLLCMGMANGWLFSRSDSLERDIDAESAPDPQCEAKAVEGQCSFYSCFELRFPCGLQGYMNRHGLYYCNRMKHYAARFNEAGQRFLNQTQKCLMDALLPSYVGDTVNCHDLSHSAFQSVSSCYLSAGFCSIFWDNKEAFSKILQPADLLDFRSIKMWREVIQIAVGCGGEHVDDFISMARMAISNPLNRLFNE